MQRFQPLSFFQELNRRNVYRVGLAYAVISWLVLQVADVVVPILALQPWLGKLVFLMLAAGLPVALIFAWAFELTPEGIKRDHEVDHKQDVVNERLERIRGFVYHPGQGFAFWHLI